MAPGGTSLIVRPGAVSAAVRGIDAVLHLATRIQPLDRIQQAEARQDNDRLCAEASAILVDTALAADVKAHVQPTVTFVYPGDRPISEDTPVGEVPVILRSALAAEQQVGPFAAAGRSGVVLRLGLLDGPGTGKDHPNPGLGATLYSGDAGCALLAALAPPSASTTSAATASASATAGSQRPSAGMPCDSQPASGRGATGMLAVRAARYGRRWSAPTPSTRRVSGRRSRRRSHAAAGHMRTTNGAARKRRPSQAPDPCGHPGAGTLPS